MSLSDTHQEQPALPNIRKYRATVRTRLALTYSALLTGSGLVLLGLVYAFMRYVPTYDLIASSATPSQMTNPPFSLATEAPQPADSIPAIESAPAAELLITSTDQMLNLLLMISLVVLLVLAFIGIAVGWAVAGRMLRPLSDINAVVRSATHGDLSQRIGLDGPRDEISELATNFDTMLERLERSFAASKRFASNASHELSTPLATSRAMLDVALAQHHDPAVRKVLGRLQLMNERSIEITAALLELARVDSANAATQLIDLSAVVREVAHHCQAAADERGLKTQFSLEPARLHGDPVLIRQLVSNLVQNATVHNLPQGGTLSIKTSTNAQGQASLLVTNTGAVLDPSEVQKLTEPFYRAAGRISAPGAKGHGLGLSIVAAIVERHQGTLELIAQPVGGLGVSVCFPAISAISR